MIVPWRVTKENARSFITDLLVFDGIAFVSHYQPDKIPPEKRSI
jgi:hypothetical protein